MTIITISPLGYDSKKATIYQVQTQGKDFSTDVLDLTVDSPDQPGEPSRSLALQTNRLYRASG